jgi:hypothetical protein
MRSDGEPLELASGVQSRLIGQSSDESCPHGLCAAREPLSGGRVAEGIDEQRRINSAMSIWKRLFGSKEGSDPMKRCDVCGMIRCRPDLDGYVESDLAGKPVRSLRAGATHRSEAESLAARAYATVHAPCIGPKTLFGRWICRDCVLDYWGIIERGDAATGAGMKVIWNE